VYDASDAASFAAARALAVGVSSLGGEGLPVVLVAAKDDLGSSPVGWWAAGRGTAGGGRAALWRGRGGGAGAWERMTRMGSRTP
jgi:hypothetical protein